MPMFSRLDSTPPTASQLQLRAKEKRIFHGWFFLAVLGPLGYITIESSGFEPEFRLALGILSVGVVASLLAILWFDQDRYTPVSEREHQEAANVASICSTLRAYVSAVEHQGRLLTRKEHWAIKNRWPYYF